ncbi:MAG: PTS sugar transporter subunit IIA, partial [Gemmatimonadaceae bacterium]|nr:PTS sugar transporter subunit IIA [Gemmatimonadaceae bacterium]
AVPHGRIGSATLTAAAATLPPIDGYDGPDGAPVRLAVLLLTPEGDARSHLQVLALLARRWHDRSVRAAILESTDDATLAARLGGTAS